MNTSKAKEETSKQCKNHLTKGKQETWYMREVWYVHYETLKILWSRNSWSLLTSHIVVVEVIDPSDLLLSSGCGEHDKGEK